MDKIKYTILLSLIAVFSTSAQSIRKNHLEMTQSEKDALVGAFYQLRNGADLINDIADFHGNNFMNTPNAIHFNLPNNPQLDVFLAWHRQNLFELEQHMQDINPNITIPFWNWVEERRHTDVLWDQNFLGQFDTDWNLERGFNYLHNLPTNSDVAYFQSKTDWLTYSNDLERGIVHAGAHMWVSGVMASGYSPKDPVFFLHHNMVDKLWQDWVEANNITPSSNIYQKTSLPRYDGTYVFDGVTLPLVNPDDIVNSKSLGVFFAENELAELESYTVSNTHRSQENFYYQYTIVAKNNFTVPTGKDAKIESVNEIVLKDGFLAEKGASFIGKIDADTDINTVRTHQVVSNQKPFDNVVGKNVYEQYSLRGEIELKLYPNPVRDNLRIEMNNSLEGYEIEILSIQGAVLLNKKLDKGNKLEINLSQLNSGVHFIRIIQNNEIIAIEKLIKL